MHETSRISGRAPAVVRVELGRVERLVALRSVAELRDLTSPELAVLASIAGPRLARAGSTLAAEGGPTTAMFLVVEGELRVRRRGREVARARPHDLVCTIDALASDPSGCECTAVEDSIVLEIAIEDLEDAFEDQPALLVALVRRLAREASALRRTAFDREGSTPRAGSAPGHDDRAAGTDLVERMLFLRRTAALGARSIDGVAMLAVAAREVRRPAGDVLWRAGDEASVILAIVAGTIELRGPSGRPRAFGADALVGELESLAGEPRSWDAAVTRDVVALAFDRDVLFDAWEDHTELGIEVLRAVARTALALGEPET